MSDEMMRAHVVIPKALVETIDALVGKRHRSEFLTEAEEKEVRPKLLKAAEKARGSLEHVDTPGWESSEFRASSKKNHEPISIGCHCSYRFLQAPRAGLLISPPVH